MVPKPNSPGPRLQERFGIPGFVARLIAEEPDRQSYPWRIARLLPRNAAHAPRRMVINDPQVAWKMRTVMTSPMTGSAIGTPAAMNTTETMIPALT